MQKGRIVIVDGPRILTLLQNLYKKTHLIPSDITLVSKNRSRHESDGVFLGTLSGIQVVELYQKHGDALFFENIQIFLAQPAERS